MSGCFKKTIFCCDLHMLEYSVIAMISKYLHEN